MAASRRRSGDAEVDPLGGAGRPALDDSLGTAFLFEERLLGRVAELASDPDVEGFSAVYRLLTMGHRLRADFETTVHRPHQSSRATFGILVRLEALGSLTQNELAKLMDVSPANMSVLLGRLERMGLVERVRSTADRRAVLVGLLEKGRKQIRAELRDHERRSSEWARILNDTELKKLLRLLEKLLRSYPTSGAETVELAGASESV